jgi:two-component system cell cycle response regulator
MRRTLDEEGISLARVLVVDDSPSVRSLVGDRIRKAGHLVEEVASGEAGAESALADCPDVVVTDLVMSGISGVQLCRLLRSDPSTSHVPVILLTSSGDKRSRFWARSAGAVAYVSKDKLDDLVLMLPTLASTQPPPALATTDSAFATPAAVPQAERAPPRRSIHERVSAILDVALFDSVVAGEVRALGGAGTMPQFFGGLTALVSDVLNYRWLALLPCRAGAPLFVHGHPSEREAVEAMARSVLGAGPERVAHVVQDDRAVRGDGTAVEEWAIAFGGKRSGRLAVAPIARGMSRDERRLLSIVATEAGGPLEMTALYEDARRLATVDTLTGLLNRRAFLDVLDRESARSERHSYPLSILLLDADHFKRVNDTYGHAAGDAVLQGFARVLGTVARRSDVVARWGGEEFVVALPQTGAAGARVAAERVRRALAEARYPIPGGDPLRMTASVGAATAQPPWTKEAVVSAADAAMYAAKARGRNRVEFASEGAQGGARDASGEASSEVVPDHPG